MNNTTLINTFPVSDFGKTKQKVLNWIKRFDTFCFLDNHNYHIAPHTQECLAGAGIRRKIAARETTALQELQSFIDTKKSWLFGHIGYDINTIAGKTPSVHADHICFPGLFFFEPCIVIRFDENQITIDADNPSEIFGEIDSSDIAPTAGIEAVIAINSRFTKDEYLDTVRQLQKHILRGDCYEINFCQEFFATNVVTDPVKVYRQLAAISPNPFSALYRVHDKWLICASPERFLMKKGNTILSQPMKGTSKRVAGNKTEDEESRKQLFRSKKDRSENVMVVDLVRNDLSRVCIEGSVKVDELYGVYSFPQVHQMISTISGHLKDDVSFTDIIRATFPMGSMTGAPKERVMELIEQYEKTKRGIFSGSLGYISPEGEFDLNVVIRSIMYNEALQYLSYQVGSGITFYSHPESEWDECLLKAQAIKKVLSD